MTSPSVETPPPRPTNSSRALPVLPAYGSGSLVELMPAIGARLGVPGFEHDPLGLPDAERYVVVLVDGLGWNLLRRSARDAPYLAGLAERARSLTAGVPSTTVTSLSSLGTGLVPGQHGMVGYTSRVPGTNEILNALTWESAVPPRVWQAKATFFERAAAAGVAVSTFGLSRFEGSGLTEAALRGARFVGLDEQVADTVRATLTADAALRGWRSVVYAYERELDHVGHMQGCRSLAWRDQLVAIDRRCARLRAALPDEVRLVVTGDHGMVDVPSARQILAEDVPDLMAGVSVLAGEGRFRQVYTDHDRPQAVAARWRDHLGHRAWVRTRDEAVEEGWFGPVDPALAARYGDVLVAMRGTWAVMTRQFPRELTLVGMHGSITEEEMLVPLLVD